MKSLALEGKKKYYAKKNIDDFFFEEIDQY
jgi:hypothetical protein